ncbi:hypothetical protein ACFWBV_35055 [Streptomyces sp. NPDC060030]|uniref:hypothetical protein n=1 Tax=Streptomyces sp. NPDC060030 TaxID=3347042 RepID=UPI0036773F10
MEYEQRRGNTSIGNISVRAKLAVSLPGVTREINIGRMLYERIHGDVIMSQFTLLRLYRDGLDLSGRPELKKLAEELDTRYSRGSSPMTLLGMAVAGNLPRELLHPFDQNLMNSVDNHRPPVGGRPTPIGKVAARADAPLFESLEAMAVGPRHVSDAVLYELYENRKWKIPDNPVYRKIRRRAQKLVAAAIVGTSHRAAMMGVAGPGPSTMAAAAGPNNAPMAYPSAGVSENGVTGPGAGGAGGGFWSPAFTEEAFAERHRLLDQAGAAGDYDRVLALHGLDPLTQDEADRLKRTDQMMREWLRPFRAAAVVRVWRQTGGMEPWQSEPLRVEEVYAAAQRNRALVTSPWHIGLPWGDEDLRLVLRWREVDILLTESGQQPADWEAELRVHLPFGGEEASSWSAGDVALQISENRVTARPALGRSTATTSLAKDKGKGKAAAGKRRAVKPAGSEPGPARGKRARTRRSDDPTEQPAPAQALASVRPPGGGDAEGGLEAPGPMIAGEFDLFPSSGGEPAGEESYEGDGDDGESLFGPDLVSEEENPGGGSGLFPSNSGDEMWADSPTGPANNNNTDIPDIPDIPDITDSTEIADSTELITRDFTDELSWTQLFAPEDPSFWAPLGPGPEMGADEPGDSSHIGTVITGSQAQHPTGPSLGQDPVSPGAGDWTRLHPDMTRPDPAPQLDESMPATDAGLPRSGPVGDGPAPDPVADAPWSIDGADVGNMPEGDVTSVLDAWDAVMTTDAQNLPDIDLIDFLMHGQGENTDPYLPADITMAGWLQEPTSLSFNDIFGIPSPPAAAGSDEADRSENTIQGAEPVPAPRGPGSPPGPLPGPRTDDEASRYPDGTPAMPREWAHNLDQARTVLETASSELLQHVGQLMGIHRSPGIIADDTDPTTPQNRYRALQNDIAALIALSLTNQHNPDDHNGPAWQLSKQLRDHFHTHPTPALPGGAPPPTTSDTHNHASPSHHQNEEATPPDTTPVATPQAQTRSPDDTEMALTGRTLTHAHLDRIAQLAPHDLSHLKTLLRINPDGVPARTSHLPDHVLHELFNPHTPQPTPHNTQPDTTHAAARLRGGAPDLVRSWKHASALPTHPRSAALRKVDAAVENLTRDLSSTARMDEVLATITDWQKKKDASSKRWAVVTDLQRHVQTLRGSSADASGNRDAHIPIASRADQPEPPGQPAQATAPPADTTSVLFRLPEEAVDLLLLDMAKEFTRNGQPIGKTRGSMPVVIDLAGQKVTVNLGELLDTESGKKYYAEMSDHVFMTLVHKYGWNVEGTELESAAQDAKEDYLADSSDLLTRAKNNRLYLGMLHSQERETLNVAHDYVRDMDPSAAVGTRLIGEVTESRLLERLSRHAAHGMSDHLLYELTRNRGWEIGAGELWAVLREQSRRLPTRPGGVVPITSTAAWWGLTTEEVTTDGRVGAGAFYDLAEPLAKHFYRAPILNVPEKSRELFATRNIQIMKDSFDTSLRDNRDKTLANIAREAGVVSTIADSDIPPDLIDLLRSDVPEIPGIYLKRHDATLTSDDIRVDTSGNIHFDKRTLTVGTTQILVHYDPTSPREWLDTRINWIQRAAQYVHAAGFDPSSLEVYVPKYTRRIEMGRPAPGQGGRLRLSVFPVDRIPDNGAICYGRHGVIIGANLQDCRNLPNAEKGAPAHFEEYEVGVLIHELGHFFANEFLDNDSYSVALRDPSKIEWIGQVSEYAAIGNHPAEALAEYFTGIVFGRPYDRELEPQVAEYLQEFYYDIGGPRSSGRREDLFPQPLPLDHDKLQTLAQRVNEVLISRGQSRTVDAVQVATIHDSELSAYERRLQLARRADAIVDILTQTRPAH